MGNLEYSFDNILKSYIDTGRQLTNHQVNLISSNKNMVVKTYLRKRAIAVKKIQSMDVVKRIEAIFLDKELELFKKYDKKSYDDYMNYIPNFKSLWLNDNNLTTLPKSITNLTNLERLWLSKNKLTTLKGISNLKNLEMLDLSYNELTLTSLEGIDKLTNLKFLSLYGNELTSLPDSIGNLKNLEMMDLRGNPITIDDAYKNKKEIERIKKLLPNTNISTF
jgi:Leucine-rich repeat (LRR) protein